MKRLIPITLIVFLITGCSTLETAQRQIQKYEGSGSITVETPLQLTVVTLKETKTEDGQYTAKEIDIVHKGKFTGTRIEIHLTDYKRPIVED